MIKKNQMTSDKQLVLFVCVHNSARSKIAEAIFNEEIKSKNINAIAKSAGTNPSNDVHSFAKLVLQEIGIEINDKPMALNDAMTKDANIIINMGCMENNFCPAIFVDKIDDWGLEDPSNGSVEKFRETREKIKSKVNELIEKINNAPNGI